MTPLVSVIVPIYNLAPYLARSLDSLIKQDYAALEIILIDDASTDDSAAAIRALADQDARVVPVFLPANGGVSAARNAGLDVASGQYVAFMDGDDWLEPHTIATFVAALERGPYDLVTSSFYIDAPQPRPLPARLRRDRALTRKQLLRGMLAPIGQIRGYLWNKLYRRSVIEAQHLRFDEGVAIMEDELFTTEYALATNRFYFRGEPGYHHVVRSDSATQSLGILGALPQQLSALWRIQQLIRATDRRQALADEPAKVER
ncbi:glycosyltransferase family 2 protein [Lacticaseibacillus absianus]|uniref:glycosyltransferase family 2 protein n=1 Tax=Lacticaseibacillus absianus TaxID=2729623 RepID=UPI0015CDB7AE|nr:glycosyltransferase family A protein [Lacticaseibacillus absianus]